MTAPRIVATDDHDGWWAECPACGWASHVRETPGRALVDLNRHTCEPPETAS